MKTIPLVMMMILTVCILSKKHHKKHRHPRQVSLQIESSSQKQRMNKKSSSKVNLPCNNYQVEIQNESKMMENFKEISYEPCVEMTSMLGMGQRIESFCDYKEVKIKTNRMIVKVTPDNLLISDPFSKLEISNVQLQKVKSINQPVVWKGQRTAICVQLVMHPKLYGLSKTIEFISTEKPQENVWDTICFHSQENLEDWVKKVQGMFICKNRKIRRL